MNWYKKAQQNTLNLLHSREEDLREAFDLMEYPGFYDESNNKPEYSILESRNKLSEFAKEKNDFINRTGEWENASEGTIEMFKEDFDDETDTLGISIYGNGGIHRYFARKNGDLMFSQRHGENESTEKARGKGFEIM
jgi:hypothetical protein